jgi:16S rRNA (uracil1498-N3)-methyltransferase
LPADAAPSYVYAAELGEPGARVTLDADESHYLARVCRVRAGERIALTNGRGALAQAVLLTVARRVEVEIEKIEHRARERRAEIWCGAPEGQRADWLVEKLAELGVDALQPVDCARAEWKSFDRRVERWRRLALAGLRQSRGAWLLEIRTPIRLLDAPIPQLGELRFLADPEGAAPPQWPSRGSYAVGLIGPAEGLEPQERWRAMDSGFRPMKLGSNRLRCETAALAWAAWWAMGAD